MDDVAATARETSNAQRPLADVLFSSLLERLYDGRLSPGSVVNEAVIAAEFDTSRGPVREAVRRLQGIQLVTREPYMRARVRTFSAEDAAQLFDMRIGLEGYACRLAADRMPLEEIDRLLQDLTRERRRYESGSKRSRGAPTFDFHERVVRGSRNRPIINALCGDLYHLLRIYRRISGAAPDRKDASFDEHWQIGRALKARDGDLAESLMRSHIARASKNLFRSLADRNAASRSDPREARLTATVNP